MCMLGLRVVLARYSRRWSYRLHRPDIELGSYISVVSFADAALGPSLDEQL